MKLLIVCALTLVIAYAYEWREYGIASEPKVQLEASISNGNYAEISSQPKVQIEARITNGNYAAEGQFPYQVALDMEIGGSIYELCGGSLIGNQWVLTAAHCTVDAKSAIVYLGTVNRVSGAVKQTVSKSNFIIHPNYNRYSRSNDISLIKIQPVTFNAKIQPVSLPTSSCSCYVYIGDQVITTGWGQFATNFNSASTYLRYAPFQVISNDICKYVFPAYASNENICVNSYVGSSICTGDTGGPLVLANSKVQMGVASFVEDCNSGKPALFTCICSYLDWIKSKTGISNNANIVKVNNTVITKVNGK